MWFDKNKDKVQQLEQALAEAQALEQALRQDSAMIEFAPDGTITAVNDLFLQVVGYRRDEVMGQHHRMFCSNDYVNSEEYRNFWRQLAAGQFASGSFPRINKQGERLWLRATYFPVQLNGRVVRVIKLAQDVTANTEKRQRQEAVMDALDRSQAIIEFTPDGTIQNANENFLRTMGYRLEEIKGKHHKMFCTEGFNREYPDFWQQLGQGRIQNGKFERRDKQGRIIWLEASYNPILDSNKRVVKVIKFARDITERVTQALQVREASELARSNSADTVNLAQNGSGLLRASVTASAQVAAQVGDVAQSISNLSSKSAEISAIVTTISSIAEQTNLLALNAAIEAARAGEHGRGFAVVADEVRSLASRTNSSTLEIDEMVKANEALTRAAMEQMEKTQQQTRQVGEQIQQAADVIEQIRHSAEDVAATVARLN
ncbi:methyl-accepting chemotaxis protein [Thalassolituus hydrocarboniclasticus]|uniref:PAS domain-containing methyl-accepting chemotaxis protein n=1 Tax=Thalassolituus hydrocarboniclasticus TaxID=2742796 RepID=A0ABY6A6Q0_9GAMM|nr:PAS domain-containing methyl-accepting chemotaxis protein [Thalassolituus hydrocarboniclasticus]UXD86340.1 PAS domain-containing methyl-accepting chemotaxis protein [Thalassolituus hydrocarboniclasticus]